MAKLLNYGPFAQVGGGAESGGGELFCSPLAASNGGIIRARPLLFLEVLIGIWSVVEKGEGKIGEAEEGKQLPRRKGSFRKKLLHGTRGRGINYPSRVPSSLHFRSLLPLIKKFQNGGEEGKNLFKRGLLLPFAACRQAGGEGGREGGGREKELHIQIKVEVAAGRRMAGEVQGRED